VQDDDDNDDEHDEHVREKGFYMSDREFFRSRDEEKGQDEHLENDETFEVPAKQDLHENAIQIS